MRQYWSFDVARVAHRMGYAGEPAEADRLEDARRAIEVWRETIELRPRQPIPL
jgi:hypothetical protein